MKNMPTYEELLAQNSALKKQVKKSWRAAEENPIRAAGFKITVQRDERQLQLSFGTAQAQQEESIW